MKSDGNRDIAIEHLLRQSRQAHAPAAPAGACLDAATLAAWADGALAGEAAAAAAAHAADCSRCLAQLSAVVRTAPVAVAESRWARLGAARWLVPLTAAAAAVAIWIAVPESPLPIETAPPRRDGAVAVAPQQPGAPPVGQVRAQEGAVPDAREEAAPVSAKSEADEAKRVSSSTPPPSAAAPARSFELAARALTREKSAGPLIVSADPSVRWRLDAAGLVERSTTGGASWDRIPTGADVALAAGAAPSASVCWVVGQAGAVLLTTNARDWQRLPFPAPVDLVGVRATDARSALVATADGRAFATEDGGLTWMPRPLQEF